jgi:hypothetical protein
VLRDWNLLSFYHAGFSCMQIFVCMPTGSPEKPAVRSPLQCTGRAHVLMLMSGLQLQTPDKPMPSAMHRRAEVMISELEQPVAGSEPVHFPNKFAVSHYSQLSTILWKNRQVYWRYTGASMP